VAKNNASVDGSVIDRHIYNPFPRAVGWAARSGMSRGAAHVLSRLSVYCNWTGETFVGFDSLVAETQGSRQYISEALSELYALGRITRKKRSHMRSGARLSDLKQIWCTAEELLAAGVKEADLDNYPTRSRLELDEAKSGLQTKARDKRNNLNKTTESPKSGLQTKDTDTVTFEPKSSSPVKRGCLSTDTLSPKSLHDIETEDDAVFLEKATLSLDSRLEPIENLKTKPEYTINSKNPTCPGCGNVLFFGSIHKCLADPHYVNGEIDRLTQSLRENATTLRHDAKEQIKTEIQRLTRSRERYGKHATGTA
jgi:hypothetical protein